MQRLRRIFWLGLKEMQSLRRDKVMIGLLIYSFSFGLIMEATGTSTSVNNASIAFVDEDNSPLSRSLAAAFLPPEFQTVAYIDPGDAGLAMDRGEFLFIVVIPPGFEADLRARKAPEIQVMIDATAMEQAGIGAGYIQNILSTEIQRYAIDRDLTEPPQIDLILNSAFNPNRDTVQFQSIVSLINNITMLTIILTGAALMREREHGTIEHLLAMPLAPFDVAMAKIWANGAIVLAAAAISMLAIVEGVLDVPVAGSRSLFFLGATLYLFSATALGVFLATVARSMAQFALLIILTIMPMQLLSGGETPVEGQPEWLQVLTLALPSRHFIASSQAIIFKGASFETVAVEFALVTFLGLALLAFSLVRFRRSIAVDH